ALRWPERELVSVPAARVYAEPARPLAARGEEAGEAPSAQQAHDRLLFFDDYAAKLRVAPALGGAITIPEENAVAALEVMSRFAVDPRWLIHLPPTMAACPTATEGPWLEHPEPALDFFVKRGVADLVAQEKHMGSRALIALARDADAARRRFGVEDGKAGVIYTRTGRPFFTDAAREAEVAARLGAAMTAAGLWDDLASDWALLDAEVMPWSAKAQELLRRQYRPTATAAAASAAALAEALADAEAAARAAGREPPPELAAMRDDAATRGAAAARMRAVMEGYCWEAETVDALKIAPFHLIAAEGAVLLDPSRPHEWHMGVAARLAAQDPILVATGWRRLDAADPGARAALVDWWTGHTEAGGEGLVLKPATVIARDAAGKLVQPAMKVRGRDYLRLIYGPDYDRPENLRRLRVRGLGRKFSLAEREFKLGLEGVRRFVEGAPLAKVHECALAVLALESEPVDPRL
ncbi:MAG: polynucleotide kinase-phosphatase, partial [Pseudomonadota bacterium]